MNSKSFAPFRVRERQQPSRRTATPAAEAIGDFADAIVVEVVGCVIDR